METILSLRFFVFQYGIVYKLKLQGSDTSFSVQRFSLSTLQPYHSLLVFVHMDNIVPIHVQIYGWSWAALAIFFFLFKVGLFHVHFMLNILHHMTLMYISPLE